MKYFVHSIALIALFTSLSKPTHACAIEMSVYGRPHYIDLDYESAQGKEYDESYNGKLSPYFRLLSQYIPEGQLKETDLYIPLEETSDSAKIEKITDPSAKAYAEASVHFYKHDYDQALAKYTQLTNSLNPEIKEQALYMLGRVPLITAQKKWDGNSPPSPETIDYHLLAQSRKAFEHYITTYPQGRFTHSAKGLQRRLAYLGGDQERLNVLLSEMLNELFRNAETSQFKDNVHDRVVEFYHYAKNSTPNLATDHPLTLAAFLMLHSINMPKDRRETLTQRENDFTSYKGLLRFLRALTYTQHKNYEELLRTTPEEELSDDPAIIATEVLRAEAFTQLGKPIEAISCWKRINNIHKNDDIAQLNLAKAYITAHDYQGLLSKNAPLSNKRIIKDFLQYALTTDELIKLYNDIQRAPEEFQSESRSDIEHELFRRYVFTAQFKEMSSLYSQAKTPDIYEKIRKDIEVLSKKPADALGLGHIGLFLYQNFIAPESPALGFKASPPASYSEDSFNEIRPYCTICASYEKQPWAQETRWSAYTYLLKAADLYHAQKKHDETEAKVLHTLIGCFRSNNYMERCDVPNTVKQSEGQKWWQWLHTKYPKSSWTRKTPYWY